MSKPWMPRDKTFLWDFNSLH